MVHSIQVTRWKTFDGKEFATRAEADLYELDHVDGVLGTATVEDFREAIRDPNALLCDAILRAASLIRKARRAAAVPEAPPPIDP